MTILGSSSKEVLIHHTRIKQSVNIVNVRNDEYNPMIMIVDFQYDLPVGYFKTIQETGFGVYVDREYVEEVFDKMAKVQVRSFDVVQKIEIYAHPHPGFMYSLQRQFPGNKIRIRFRARDPLVKDIEKHILYWDAGTGTYQTAIMGEIDALNGNVKGQYLRSTFLNI